MKRNIRTITASVFTTVILVAICCGVIISSIPEKALALEINNSNFNVDISNSYTNKTNNTTNNTYQSKVEQNITSWANSINNTINNGEEKKNDKGKKEYTKEQKANQTAKLINAINSSAPKIVAVIKDWDDGGDKDTFGNLNTIFTTASSIASLAGPWGAVIGAGLSVINSVVQLFAGNKETETSELAQAEDRIMQEFDEIKDDLSDIKSGITDLSNEINEDTNKIISEMSVALENQDDKNEVAEFYHSTGEGDFSYNQFRNYIYGDTDNNSNSSTAYYTLLQNALINDSSDELIRICYDNLYDAIEGNINVLVDSYIAPEDNTGTKSIIKAYYNYLSSNSNFTDDYKTTPEEATIKFAYDLYQTVLMADQLLLICNSYQYIQMLLDGTDVYTGCNNTSFSVSKDYATETQFDTVAERERKVRNQIAEDMAYVLGLDTYYTVKDGENLYEVDKDDTYFGIVTKGQTVYLNEMPDYICALFDIDSSDYTFYKNDAYNNGYFSVTESCTAELRYKNETKDTNTDSKTTVAKIKFTVTDCNSTLFEGFTGGTGTAEDPYLISTVGQFLKIRDGLDKHYVLTNDITFDVNSEGIEPFGYSKNDNENEVIEDFTGSLDGNGFSVNNLKIETVSTYSGLFCKLASGASVRNIIFNNVSVSASLSVANKTDSAFYSGIIAGINNGKIYNCQIKSGTGVSFELTNTTGNRNINVYVGGIAGVNSNLIQCCKLDNITVSGTSNHSFGADITSTNINNVYAGGVSGCNYGKICYSLVGKNVTVNASAESKLSAGKAVNPYITALAGGICGKNEVENISDSMYYICSEATTEGQATVEKKYGYNNRLQNLSKSEYDNALTFLKNHTVENPNMDLEDSGPIIRFYDKHDDNVYISNRFYTILSAIENKMCGISNDYRVEDFIEELTTLYDNKELLFEENCYVPNLSDENLAEINEITVTADEFNENISCSKSQYTLDIDNAIESTSFSADTDDFVTAAFGFSELDKSKITVKKSDTEQEVTSATVIGVYGFTPYNEKFDKEKTIPVDILVNVVLKDGTSFIKLKTIECKFEKNKIESVTIDASDKTFCKGDTIDLSILDGQTVTYNYTYGSNTAIFDYTKLSNPTITVTPCICCEKCGSYDVETSMEDGKINYTCQEEDCKNQGSFDYNEYTSFYTGAIGKYSATVEGTYDNNSTEFSFEYDVLCPHNRDEQTYLEKTVEVAATCQSVGYTEYECTVCGEKVQKSFTWKSGHNLVEESGDTATCTKSGHVGKIYCSTVGCDYVAEEGHDTLPLGHKYDNGITTAKEHTCSSCGESVPHEFTVTESVENRDGVPYEVYSYECKVCGYNYEEAVICNDTESLDTLPTVFVSNGFASVDNEGNLNSDEVVVYVQLLNCPEEGITAADFGIRYDSRLELVEYEDGCSLPDSVSVANKTQSGCNFVWAKADGIVISNLLKLTFKLPYDAKLNNSYNITVVYEEGGGFSVNEGQTQQFITKSGTITVVKRLPGDVNNDGTVDILDAVEIGKFRTQINDGKISYGFNYENGDKDEVKQTNFAKYANVDLNRTGDIKKEVTVTDMVKILRYIAGGYGVNLLPQEFSVELDSNCNDNDVKNDSISVSIYNSTNNTYSDELLKPLSRAGYKFDGWFTKPYGGEQVNIGDDVTYNNNQIKQTLYAHWTRNSVTLNGNGATSNGTTDKLYTTPTADNISGFKREYDVCFVDKNNQNNTKSKLTYKLSGWSTTEDGEKEYEADLSDLDLNKADLGELTLYAIWEVDQMPEFPSWTKYGYESPEWYFDENYLNGQVTSSTTADKLIEKKNGENQIFIYAKFKPIEFTIYFDANGGNGTKIHETNHNVESVVALSHNSSITRQGYCFKGWSLDKNASNATYLDGATVGYIGKNGAKEVTLYAVWEPYKYSIVYKVNPPINALTVTIGNSVPISRDEISDDLLTKDADYCHQIGSEFKLEKNIYSVTGWTFVGWSLKSDGSGEIYTDEAIVSNLAKCTNGNEQISLYAVWKVDPYTVGQNTSNNVIVSDTNGENKYTVYNDAIPTNQAKTEKIIVDYTNSNITTISEAAFKNWVGITDVIIVGNIKTIEKNAFYGCTGLTSIEIPNSVTSIGESAFRGCTGLASIDIPNSVTSIGSCAFYRCDSLTNVTLGSNLKTIGNNAFSYLSSLYKVTNNSGLTVNLGSKDETFGTCSLRVLVDNTGNKSYLDNGYTYTETSDSFLFRSKDGVNELIAYVGKETDVTLPKTFNGSTYSLSSVKGLVNVTIPGSIKVESFAFSYCYSLRSVLIENGVTSIGSYAFYNCTGLTSIEIPDSVTSIGGSAFSGCTGLTSIEIPSSVTSIGGSAFSGCTGLTSIEIPSSVTSIGSYAFSGCSSLKTVTFAESSKLTSIGSEAFYNCSSLTSIEIPSSVTTIGDSAFSGCTGVIEIYVDKDNLTYYSENNCIIKKDNKQLIVGCKKSIIPSDVISIGSSAFSGCTGLTSIEIPDLVTSIGEYTFYGCTGLTSIEIPSSVTSIGSSAFSWCTGLTSLKIQNGITGIGNSAFENCTRLTSIEIPNSVTSIGINAFRQCSGITNVSVGTGVTSLDFGTFSDCSSLTNIDLPNALTSIGRCAFENCTGLTTVKIPNTVTEICSDAFYDCTGLTSIEIPNSVTSINNWTFYNCTSLSSVKIGTSVAYIGVDAFYGCTGLTSIDIPNSVTSIKDRAFYGCSDLTSVTLGSGVSSIDDTVFIGCSSLCELNVNQGNTSYHSENNCIIKTDSKTIVRGCQNSTISENVTAIGNYAFRDCTGLTGITIPKSVTSIGVEAFANCYNLATFTYNGDQSGWDSITKGTHWDNCVGNYTDNGTYTVSCTCFTGDTLVVLADGSTARLDSLKVGDVIMSWNAVEGKFEPMPISMFWNHGDGMYYVIDLSFSNGKTVSVVTEHGFFDSTLNKYVYIDYNNYEDYIGHEFACMTDDGKFEDVTLTSAECTYKYTSCYSLRTACNDNAIVEGFMTLTHEDIPGFLTYFEFGENYMYDKEKMEADIAEYGLYTYEDWADYVSYEEFVALNGQYLKIVIGKGYLTYEDILSLIAGMR